MMTKNMVTYKKKKYLHYLIVVIILVMIVPLNLKTTFGFDEIVPPIAPAPLTVYTDKLTYVGNDTVVISGKAELTNTENTVLVQIFDPQKVLIMSYQVSISPEGTYLLRIHDNFGISGTYIVRSTLQNGYNTERPFLFIAGPYKLVVKQTQYLINYNMTSGLLNNIYASIEDKSLTLSLVNVTSSTRFTIELPRNLTDSKLLKDDSNFAVLISTKESDFKQANFTEIQNDSNSRTLSIDIPYDGIKNPSGMWNVKIMGTIFIPEFGLFAGMIIAISIIGSIIISRRFSSHF